ncbi:uncharacterized protein LOC129781445 [Toxorhynchites rutilus septentrionalis]|uniref:uncharacterized protein LOC129781445 n=2 Tax=Toxorhynchites rutilus septentrionalis TaxID=329112 RepID=UPI00247A8D3E|nr:uncharacterized protein LOC129781445 [Toxorhynchites rutilus septentrionalis]
MSVVDELKGDCIQKSLDDIAQNSAIRNDVPSQQTGSKQKNSDTGNTLSSNESMSVVDELKGDCIQKSLDDIAQNSAIRNDVPSQQTGSKQKNSDTGNTLSSNESMSVVDELKGDCIQKSLDDIAQNSAIRNDVPSQQTGSKQKNSDTGNTLSSNESMSVVDELKGDCIQKSLDDIAQNSAIRNDVPSQQTGSKQKNSDTGNTLSSNESMSVVDELKGDCIHKSLDDIAQNSAIRNDVPSQQTGSKQKNSDTGNTLSSNESMSVVDELKGDCIQKSLDDISQNSAIRNDVPSQQTGLKQKNSDTGNTLSSNESTSFVDELKGDCIQKSLDDISQNSAIRNDVPSQQTGLKQKNSDTGNTLSSNESTSFVDELKGDCIQKSLDDISQNSAIRNDVPSQQTGLKQKNSDTGNTLSSNESTSVVDELKGDCIQKSLDDISQNSAIRNDVPSQQTGLKQKNSDTGNTLSSNESTSVVDELKGDCIQKSLDDISQNSAIRNDVPSQQTGLKQKNSDTGNTLSSNESTSVVDELKGDCIQKSLDDISQNSAIRNDVPSQQTGLKQKNSDTGNTLSSNESTSVVDELKVVFGR